MGSPHVRKKVMRIAALDIGTNTALLLIAEGDDAATLTIVREEHAIPRLGEGVDRNGAIGAEALARLDEVLTRYKQIVAEASVDKIDAVGTSALRDASNRDEVLGHIAAVLGTKVRLITGDEEARLTYMGGVS